MKLIIYTDGASRGNPGLSSYGFVVKNEAGKILYEEGKFLGVNTNNFAEYSGVLAAVLYVKASFKNLDQMTIEFLMDSKLAVEQLSGRYKVKSETLRVFHHRISSFIKEFKGISFTHIPRELNKEADRNANTALDTISSLR